MIVLGWMGWMGCSSPREPSDPSEPSIAAAPDLPTEYAGCTQNAVVTSTWVDPDLPDPPPLFITLQFDAVGWTVLWSTTYDPSRAPSTLQTWQRRADGQVTDWQRYRQGALLERTATWYDGDGVRSRTEEDEDGDGVVDQTTDFVVAGGLVREEEVDDGADGVVDWVYVLTYDDQDRLVSRSGRFDSVDGAEFHHETWTQGAFGWVVHETSVILDSYVLSTRTFDAGGRPVAATTEDLSSWHEDRYVYLDDDELPDGGTAETTGPGLDQFAWWTLERDTDGRSLLWIGDSDDDEDGAVDYTSVETSTWDCPDR